MTFAIRSGILAFATLLSTLPAQAQDPRRLQDPVVLQATGGELQHVLPIAIASLDGRARLLSLEVGRKKPKLRMEVVLWTEEADRSWTRTGALPVSSMPRVVPLADGFGLLTVGDPKRGSYAAPVAFTRLAADGSAHDRQEIAPAPAGEYDRRTVCNAHAVGGAIVAFLLLETRGVGNRLEFARSTDGGKTWSLRDLGETSMSQDTASALAGVQWSAEAFGTFVVGSAGLRLKRTSDGGASWTEEPVGLSDDLGPDADRGPLAIAPLGENGLAVVYLASTERGRGRYYLAESTDGGRTWASGRPITAEGKIEDPSYQCSVAGGGSNRVFSFVEVLGRWTQGEVATRLLVSSDEGRSWTSAQLERFYRGVPVGPIVIRGENDRILLAVAIGLPDRSRSFLTVQEYSTHPAPAEEPTPDETARITGLIADLGSEDWGTRDAATRRLAAIGKTARRALQAAARDEDPEVARRATSILETIFPACIRLSGDE